MGKTADECNLDIDAWERARALHRVVRAMHDGHCPSCGHLGPAEDFYSRGGYNPGLSMYDEYNTYRDPGHSCPSCGFSITDEEARDALAEFRPCLNKSVEVFEVWRKNRPEG